MLDRSARSSLLWRLEREIVLNDEAPAAALVSVAFAAGEYFLVARGDIPPVDGRAFDPERDIPSSRLEVSLEVGGVEATQQSAGYEADRESWEALLRWQGADPAPDLRVTLELDGRRSEYLLALVD